MLGARDGARAPERPVLCLQEQQRLSEGRSGEERDPQEAKGVL